MSNPSKHMGRGINKKTKQAIKVLRDMGVRLNMRHHQGSKHTGGSTTIITMPSRFQKIRVQGYRELLT